jgi:recombination protein RecT
MGAIAVRDQLDDLKRQISQRQIAITRSLPPGVMSFARYEQAVLTLVGRNLELLRCDRASLVGAVLRAAHLGLDPDPALGQAWFLPFKGIVQFIPGYKGLVQLAWRTGELSRVGGEVVREGDEFEYELGSNQFLRHRPKDNLEGKITHAYALFKTKGADEATFRVMPIEAIEKIRMAAPSAKAKMSPWMNSLHYPEMCIKTAMRRVMKLAPASGERHAPLHKAIDLDERADLGLQQFNEAELLGEEQNAETETTEGTNGTPDSNQNS